MIFFWDHKLRFNSTQREESLNAYILESSVPALNLTRGESRMKVRLMVLPNALSGGA